MTQVSKLWHKLITTSPTLHAARILAPCSLAYLSRAESEGIISVSVQHLPPTYQVAHPEDVNWSRAMRRRFLDYGYEPCERRQVTEMLVSYFLSIMLNVESYSDLRGIQDVFITHVPVQEVEVTYRVLGRYGGHHHQVVCQRDGVKLMHVVEALDALTARCDLQAPHRLGESLHVRFSTLKNQGPKK